jgi:hypothetical protein
MRTRSNHILVSSVNMASKRTKGLSFDEKRKRLCEIFYETRDFFQLKDLEKIAPKTKGIVTQSVKEVLQSLVDDDLVKMEKIGTSNYFWSFPSAALQARKNKIAQLNKELSQLTQAHDQSCNIISQLESERPDTEESVMLQQELSTLDQFNKSYQKELEKYKEMDPDLFEAKKAQLKKFATSINQWTENIFILQSHCSNKFNIEKSAFATQFEISEDMDYVEC